MAHWIGMNFNVKAALSVVKSNFLKRFKHLGCDRIIFGRKSFGGHDLTE